MEQILIKVFGTFILSRIKYGLEGTTNQFERDIKRRRPVFLVSKGFVEECIMIKVV